jgi:hypothetical protein
VRRRNAIRCFHPCVGSYEGEIYWRQASLLNRGGALAAATGGLQRPALWFSATWRHLPPAPPTPLPPGEDRSTMWLP